MNSARRTRLRVRRWIPNNCPELFTPQPKTEKKRWRRFHDGLRRDHNRFLGWHERWLWEGRELFMTDDSYETFLYGKSWAAMTVEERTNKMRRDR